MNYEGEKFLLKLYNDLDKEESVIKADKKSGKNSGDKFELLRKYLKRIEKQEKVFDGAHEQLEKYLKNRYHDKYVIKKENIKDSYWKHLEKIELENGFGYVVYTDEMKEEEIKTIIKSQEESLDKWIDYLMKETANYPMWVRYWAFQGMIKLGEYDKESNTYRRRTKSTTAPFPELNSEMLAKTIELAMAYTNKEEIDDEKIEEILKTRNFGKIYAYNMWKLLEEKKENKNRKIKTEEGKWLKFEKGDVEKLVDSIDGKATGWCIAGKTVAENYLNEGDLYIYYTKDEKEKYTVPRACIRTRHKMLVEVRGIEKDQNMESEMVDIVDEKLDEFPDKEEYKKKLSDMEKLTEISKKTERKEKLTTLEEKFLYEYDNEIEGFGWEKDPRIEKLREKNIITDKDVLLKMIKEKDYGLRHATENGQKVRYGLNHVSNALRKDKQVVLEVVKEKGYELKYADETLKKDKEVILEAVKNNGDALKYADETLKKDKEVVLEAVKNNGDTLEYVDETLKKDKEVVLEAVKVNPLALKYADETLQDDIKIALLSAKKFSHSLEYVSKNLRNDKAFILEVTKEDSYALSYASENLKKDKELILEIIKYKPAALNHADETLKKDKEVVLEAVKQDINVLKYASKDLQKDEEILLEVIKKAPYKLHYIINNLKGDKNFILKVVKENAEVLKYVDETLKNDKEVVLEAVKNNGFLIEYVSEKLKEDEEVVLEAVKNNGYVLKYVDEKFYDNKKIVLEAVKSDGEALKFASKRLQEDKQVVLEAVKNLGYIPHTIEFLKEKDSFMKDVERIISKNNKKR